MAERPLPTIFVVHPRERRRKCTIEPLRGRAGYVFWTFPRIGPEPLDGYVRLGLGGELLGPADQEFGLLVLDGTWRLVDRMARQFADVPVRSLGPWQTAYPRQSKLFSDPSAGLATIEALYAACVQTGRSTRDLLDSYMWKDDFLRLNAALLPEGALNGVRSP
jgi:pre-rRNA-processing protein TSR3